MSLAIKYRPTSFKDVVGQDAVVTMLRDFLQREALPHALLLSGPSGVGKTTLARIVARRLECSDFSFHEINCAEVQPMDMVRQLQELARAKPFGGQSEVFCLDEVQSLSRATFSQQALLKILEEAPADVYYILCTTDPSRIIKTILTRCSKFELTPLGDESLRTVLQRALAGEGRELKHAGLDQIIAHADGCAREALNILGQVLAFSDPWEGIQAIPSLAAPAQGKTIAQLLFDRSTTWDKLAAHLRKLPAGDGEVESLRRGVLGYASVILLGGKGPQGPWAELVIHHFGRNFFDSGRAGFNAACWLCFHQRKT